jgi:hypothetical protein
VTERFRFRSPGTRLVDRLLFAGAIVIQLIVLYVPRGPGVGVPYADKAVHVAVFAMVVWTGRRVGLPGVLLALIFVAHAVVSELVQVTLLPERSGEVSDVIADLVGVAVGLTVPARGGDH